MKKRSEIELKDTWKLEDMVSDNALWEELFCEASREAENFKDFQGKLAQSADMLYQCLEFDDSYSRKLERIYTYARMRSDEDTSNETYQDMTSRALSLSNRAAELSAFIVPEILAMPQELLQEYRKADNGISHFDRVFEQLLERKEHTLKEEQEFLLAQSQEATQGASQIFNFFNNADAKFPVITGEDNQPVQITHGNYISLLESQDRRVRREAFEGLYSVYKQFSNTLAACFSSNVKQAVFYAKARNYASSRQYYLSENEVPEAVYDNLVGAVRKNLQKLHHYTAVRKRLLGVDSLHMYDLYVPLVGEADRHFLMRRPRRSY